MRRLHRALALGIVFSVLIAVPVVSGLFAHPARRSVQILTAAPANAVTADTVMSPAVRRAEVRDLRRMQVQNAARRAEVKAEVAKILWNVAYVLAVARETARAAAAQHASTVTATSLRTVPAPTAAPSDWGPCGGVYPPCYRVGTESATAGLYSAYNPGGCDGHGCFGKWQFSGAWAGKLGLPVDLSTATPAQQDEAARLLWNGGAGCGNWAACPG